MKSVLVSLCILFISISSKCQIPVGQNHIKSHEHFFSETIRRLFFDMYKESKKQSKIEYNKELIVNDIVDTFVSTLFNQVIKGNSHKDIYYNDDPEYRSIVDKIDLLQINKKNYLENNIQVQDIISHLNHPFKEIRASLYFNDRFSNCIDSVDIVNLAATECYNLALSQRDHYLRAGCFIEIGDFCKKYKSIPGTLSYYLEALYIYDSLRDYTALGNTNYSIGLLFGSKADPYFKKIASNYYQAAAYNYFIVRDTVNGLFAGLSRTYNELSVGDNNNADNNENLLEQALSLYDYLFGQKTRRYRVSVGVKCYFLALLGDYFQNKNDDRNNNIAEMFFSMELLTALNYFENPDLSYVYDALKSLSILNERMGYATRAEHYADYAIKLATLQSDENLIRASHLNKAKALLFLGKYKEGINNVVYALDSLYTHRGTNPDAINLELEGNLLLSELYSKYGRADSSKHYDYLYREIIAGEINEIDQMKELQRRYDNNVNQSIINEKNAQLFLKDMQIREREEYLYTLKDSILQYQFGLGKNKKINDSLSSRNSKLLTQNAELEIEGIKRQSELVSILTIGGAFVVTLLITVALLITILKIVKNRRDENRKNTREALVALVLSKLHNVRNNYTSFSQLIRKDMPRAIGYSDNSAYFFSYSLNKFSNKNWTLRDERNLLEAYFEAEKMLSKNINMEILFEKGTVDYDRVLFIPEVLTTLLHNSMKYAFINENINYYFNVKIIRENNLLLIHVFDNGISETNEVFEIDQEKKKGLNIIKKRVGLEFLLSENVKQVKSDFIVERIINDGFHIKFKFPYAEKT